MSVERARHLDQPRRLELDHRVRRRRHGRVLIGGYPLRILKLGSGGAECVERFRRGATPAGEAERALWRRLIDSGIAFPRVAPVSGPHPNVAVVVPVLNPPPGFARSLAAVAGAGPGAVVVVDDGNVEPIASSAATFVRHRSTLGPAAARETGWRSTGEDAEILVFVDADVSLAGRWLDQLVGHFADPDVVAVAPRVTSVPDHSLLGRYERHRSPLDLGPRSAIVRPGSPVPYVPSAVLAVKRSALEAVGGFDPDLRAGEDVDLVWRLQAAGGTILYDASIRCEHQPRADWVRWARQRRTYGRSATGLAARHGPQVSPLALSRSAAVVVGGLMGGPLTSLVSAATLAFGVGRLRRKLVDVVDQPTADAAALGSVGLAHTLSATAAAMRRAWLPLCVAGAVVSRRWRRAVLAACVIPPLLDWPRARKDVSLGAWVTLSTLDDAAYCLGVWDGALHGHSTAALRPHLSRHGV